MCKPFCCEFDLVVVYEEPQNPCNPSPCGFNAVCREKNGAGSCTCMKNFFGDPYVNCRPECVQNSDCPYDKSCMNTKCVNPCVGTCGLNAECRVIHHLPICSCPPNHTGNPSQGCRPIPIVTYEEPRHPCQPSPCGPYSVCRVLEERAVCSCQTNYFGAPPNCKPECIISSECAHNRACVNQRCTDPCPGTCGYHAQCRVTNHNPICTCTSGYTGDPFVQCVREQSKIKNQITDMQVRLNHKMKFLFTRLEVEIVYDENPCIPSPCGPNSVCQNVNLQPVCACVPNYLGRPPNCRPECSTNSECSPSLACMNERCRDPCIGSCGWNAECRVISHSPKCYCSSGYEGDPYSGCNKIIHRKTVLPFLILPITNPYFKIKSSITNPVMSL